MPALWDPTIEKHAAAHTTLRSDRVDI
jgi:hypothetical protein